MYRVEGGIQAHVPLPRRETVQKYTNKNTMPQVSRSHRELQSVMAELLWRRREVVTVVLSDVGADAAALAPPLVAVSSQTGETNICYITPDDPPLPFPTLLVQHYGDLDDGVFTWLGCSEA